MEDDKFQSDFWESNVSKSLNKDDIESGAWDRICKVRNSPIELIRNVYLGPINRPHVVLPIGLKGYVVDYPEAFNLSEQDLEKLKLARLLDYIPAIFSGFEELTLLTSEDYKIISPFFDDGIADYAELNKVDYE